jgi:hypothetical protein
MMQDKSMRVPPGIRWMGVLVLMLGLFAGGCSKEAPYKEKDFVGTWKSTRSTAPLYMYEDGVWESKKESGEIEQYGVWMYTAGKILWTVRVNEQILHDPNPVLSVEPDEFKLREQDGSVTTFTRIRP